MPYRLLIAVAMVLGGVIHSVASADPALLRSLREGATLWDVDFPDPQHGWAVGEQGAIWRTTDGGATWKSQESGVATPLTSVSFVDAQHGWAVGTEHRPLASESAAVLLVTSDGGQTWQRDPNVLLPGLKQVRFFTLQQGWAWGDSSALCPSGVSVTRDGGRSWSPLEMASFGRWRWGDFLDFHTGAIGDEQGRLLLTREGAMASFGVESAGLRTPRDLKFATKNRAWLVGSGGLLLQSGDGGQSWTSPPTPLPVTTATEIDLHTIETRGTHVWLAGSPGSRIFHSPDEGRTWEVQKSGTALPLHKLTFMDDQHGTAVGVGGVILATQDGGRSWARQRGTLTRAAVLGIFSQPHDVPLEAFLKLSRQDGYATAIEVMNRPDGDPAGMTYGEQLSRSTSVFSACGITATEIDWRFPLRQPGVFLDPRHSTQDWSKLLGTDAAAVMETHLTRLIRQWRPEVVITHATNVRGVDSVEAWLNQRVLSAVEQAADARRLAEITKEFELEPWRVRKVLGTLPPGQSGTITVASSQLAARLGGTLAEEALLPRLTLELENRPAPTAIGFQLLIDTLSQGTGQSDILSCITFAPGGEARRNASELPEATGELLRRNAQKQRHLQAILAQADKQAEAGRLLAELGQLTAGVDPAAAVPVLFQLGQQYARRGQWDAAAETMQMIASRYAKHDLARPALAWLLQYHTSSELAWQIQRRSTPLQGIDPDAMRAEQALAVGKQLEHQHPLWFAEPPVQLPLASAQRRLNRPRDAERLLSNVVRGRPDDPWRQLALGEQWLAAGRSSVGPKVTAEIVRATTKPHLDGTLDDSLWQAARPLELRTISGDGSSWPAVALLAHDDEFLYWGLSCRSPRELPPMDRSQPRPRDPDQSQHDRVELLLDLDRDGGTYYRLVVDSRGYGADACWTDAAWNPLWFIAAEVKEQTWTVEAAIPWSELCAKPPRGNAWGLQVQRIVPNAGFQAWTTPATTTHAPASLGYAVFE